MPFGHLAFDDLRTRPSSPARVEPLPQHGDCPTSNAALSVVADIRDHPLRRLVDLGVPCTIDADDPLLFDVDLVDEYETCRNVL